jgi:hypothetical protein
MVMFKFCACVLFGFSLFAQDTTEKIVFLISPPRSMSAAFARMMHARGDFEVFHEPFHLPYARKFAPEYATTTFGPEKQATYEDIKNVIFATARQRPVFIKDVSFDVEDFLLNDLDFIKNKNIHFVFLLRHPHDSALSFYKKSLDCPPALNYLLGYEAFYNIFQHIKKNSSNPLTVVLAQELSKHPKKIIEKLCSSLQIPFIPESLHWTTPEDSFNYQKEWHELKTNESMHLWHGDALKSAEFNPLTEYSVDENGNPTFNEITNPHHKKIYKQCYENNLKFYKLMQNDPDFNMLISE